jgi:hypothetical protein
VSRKIFHDNFDHHATEDIYMADLPPYRDSNGDTGVGPDRGSTTSTPRWVKMFGLIALVLVLLFVILHLTGRGLGRHTLPSRVTEHGVHQP